MRVLDESCPRCGWRYPGFHICVDLSTPEPPPPPIKKPRPRRFDRYDTNRSSLEWKASIARSMQNRAATLREKNKARDEALVQSYANGLTVREIQAETKLNPETIRRALHIARDEGRLTIRPAVRRSKG